MTKMKEYVKGGPRDRRAYLKAIGAGTLATGMVGLTGCLGREANAANNSEVEGGSDGGSEGGASNTTTQDSRPKESRTDTGADAGNNSDAEATNNEISGYKRYTNTEYGYSLEYPADWEVFEGASGDSESVHLEGSDSMDHVRVYVGETGGQTAKALSDAVIDQLGEDSEVVHREKRILSSGQQGQLFEYKIVSDEAGVVDHAKVLYVVADETAYMIEAKSIAGIDQETGQRLNRILDSFTLAKVN